MRVVQLREGLWRWACVDEPSAGAVWSTYAEVPDATVVIDPQVPAEGDDRDRFWRALDRDVERRSLPVVILRTDGEPSADADEILGRYRGRIVDPALARADGTLTDHIRAVPSLDWSGSSVAYVIDPDVIVTGPLGGRVAADAVALGGWIPSLTLAADAEPLPATDA